MKDHTPITKNSMAKIYAKLETLRQTSSSNAKVELLKEYLENAKFREVLVLMYSEKFHFNINKLPPFVPNACGGTQTQILQKLKDLAKQKGATNSDKEELARLASGDSATYDVVKRIINKSANAGFSHSLINKAWPDLIYVEPYMRCHSQKTHGKNIVYPAIIQEKADGQFDNLKITLRGIEFISRNGNTVHQLDHLREHIDQMLKRKGGDQFFNKVFMGELLVMKNGIILPRKTGNGILNQCIQGTASKEDAKCVVMRLWDVVPYKAYKSKACGISYVARLGKTKAFVSALNHRNMFGLITTETVKNEKEARAFYRKMRAQGREGAILKNTDGLWKDHTSPDCIKMKNISEGTFRVIDWKHGKEDSKYEKLMGSIKIETECGKCQVWLSGFSDKERAYDWDELVGHTFVDIEFESIIESKSRKGGIKSLYLPQYLEIRKDKTEADTLEYLESL